MMERLTIKDKDNDYILPEQEHEYNEDVDFCPALDKLGQLEDIEQELGIELITLFKAKDKGRCYFKNVLNEVLEADVDEIELYKRIIRMHERKLHYTRTYTEPLYEFLFKDYGKKWALSREELE